MHAITSEESRRQIILIYMGLALVLIAGLTFRVLGVVIHTGLDHDEAAHLLIAACNQQPYKQALAQYESSELRITSVVDWEKFMQLREPFCFGAIANDLKEWDVHPPLFLWLTNLWMFLMGNSLFAIRCLNILLSVVSILVLFYLSKDLLGEKYALLAAALYATTPAFLKISGQARSYALLGLCNLVALWAILRIRRSPTAWRWWIVWALAISLGLATEYLFVVVFAPMVSYMFLFFLKRKSLLWKQFIASVLIISPFVLGIVWMYWQQRNYVTVYGWSPEGRQPVAALATLFLDMVGGVKFNRLFDDFPLVPLLAVNAVGIGVSLCGLWTIKDHDTRWLLLLLFSATVLGPILFYTLGLGPPWAYGAKYQCTAVPYIILAAVYFVSRLAHRRLRLAAALIVVSFLVLIVAYLIRAGETKAGSLMSKETVDRLPNVGLVIMGLNPEHWGMLFPAVVSWPNTQRVLIAGPEQMLRGLELQEAVKSEESVIYVSANWYKTSTESQMNQILSILQAEFEGAASAFPPLPMENLVCSTGGLYQIYFFDRQEDG